jgi:hypothetical protein
MSELRLFIVVCAALALCGACERKPRRTMTPEVERLLRAQNQRPSPTPRPTPVGDMFDGELARRAFDAIKERAAGDLKLRELRLTPLGLSVLAEDPKDESKVVLYRWNNEGGGIEGPQPPDPFGVVSSKSLDVALVDWSLLPAMAGEAKGKAGLRKPEVAMASFSKPYGVFGGDDPVWSITLKPGEGEYKSESFEFDPKGKLKSEDSRK